MSDPDQLLHQIVNSGVAHSRLHSCIAGGGWNEAYLKALDLFPILQANLVAGLYDTCHEPNSDNHFPVDFPREAPRLGEASSIIVWMLLRVSTLSLWQGDYDKVEVI